MKRNKIEKVLDHLINSDQKLKPGEKKKVGNRYLIRLENGISHCEHCNKAGNMFTLCLIKLNNVITTFCPSCLKTAKENKENKIESIY
jgi:hypothetical protein